MVFKIKWIAVVGLALSVLSLATHFLLARYSALDNRHNIRYFFGSRQPENFFHLDANSVKLWGRVKVLRSLRPFANLRKSNASWEAPGESTNGFLFVRIKGEFPDIRSSICDAVVVARLLNATLVLPELQEVSLAKGISSKFKGFAYIFNEEHFISTLATDVKVVKNLPKRFKAAKKQKKIRFVLPLSSATPSFYFKEVLPDLKTQGIIGIVISGGRCLQSLLPAQLVDYQRLRCRVAFQALEFRHEIQELGYRMIERLQASGQPYLAYYPGLERDALAYHGCAERFQDVHTAIIQVKRSLMLKKGIIKAELNVDSELQRRNGSCPLMPEEIGIFLRALGYGPHTRIYISGTEVFGGQRALIPLRAMFNNLEDLTTLTSQKERLAVYGPEKLLPPPPPPPSFVDDEKLRLETWEKAGPRPRPLPPPPSRKKFPHESEGWWGWVGQFDMEPEATLANLRHRGHKLIWAALDYIVSLESTAFIPGFDRDGHGKPNLASLIMGHRAYASPSLRTYRPDRKCLVTLLDEIGDHLYHPNRTWIFSVRNHLLDSLGEKGYVNSSHTTKPELFLSHPIPECTCRITERDKSSNDQEMTRQFLHGIAESCPVWMQNELTGSSTSQEARKDEEFDELDDTEISASETDLQEYMTDADKQEKEDSQVRDAEDDADSDD